MIVVLDPLVLAGSFLRGISLKNWAFNLLVRPTFSQSTKKKGEKKMTLRLTDLAPDF